MLFVVTIIVLIALACALAFAPLWRTHTKIALLLSALCALSVVGIYYWKGSPDALESYWRDTPQSIEQAIAQTERTLQKDPKNAGLHIELARLHTEQGEYSKANASYQAALTIDNSQADWLIESAEVQMRASKDRRMPDKAFTQLQAGLKKLPQHPRGLLLLGAAYAQRGEAEQASRTWAQLLPQLDANAATALLNEINAVRRQAGLSDWPVEPVATKALIQTEITIDTSASVPNNAVLFVFARSAQGGMPFAVKRITTPTFPLKVSLNDSDSPMPTAKLSAQREVTVQARLSFSGNAEKQPGDLESALQTVQVGSDKTVALKLGAK